MVKEDALEISGATKEQFEFVFNRISFLDTYPLRQRNHGYCCGSDPYIGDERWSHGERLTDWVVDDMTRRR